MIKKEISQLEPLNQEGYLSFWRKMIKERPVFNPETNLFEKREGTIVQFKNKKKIITFSKNK